MSFSFSEPAVALRSSIADARGSIQFDYDDGEKQDQDTEKPPTPARRKSQINDNGVNLHSIIHSKDSKMERDSASPPVRKTSFATLPNTTTWQQQSANYQALDSQGECFIRLRRWIETKNNRTNPSSRWRTAKRRCVQTEHCAHEIGGEAAPNRTRQAKTGSGVQSTSAKGRKSGLSTDHQQGRRIRFAFKISHCFSTCPIRGCAGDAILVFQFAIACTHTYLDFVTENKGQKTL